MPETLTNHILGTSFSLVPLSTIVIGLRLYCRQFLLGRVRLDDWLILLALIITWGIATINYWQAYFNTGVHMKDMPPPDPTKPPLYTLEGTLKSWYVYQLVYLFDLGLIKLSILAFYHQISAAKTYRIIIYASMAVVSIYTIIMIFINAFECPHVPDAWSAEILFQGSGSCRDLKPIYFAQASFNIFSDVWILLLPLPVLLRLQMRRNKRIALIGIFSVGSVAVIASCARIYALHVWSTSKDIPYDGANILIWSQIEINAALISCSIPALKPLFKSTFAGSSGGQAGYQDGYYGNNSRTGASAAFGKDRGYVLESMNRDRYNGKQGGTVNVYSTGQPTESEENIVRGVDEEGDRIVKTIEVKINVENSPPGSTVGPHSRRSSDTFRHHASNV
ncbi:hypothetical protein TWF106_007105 [Orbilia oligospora]|uniref:Rhodopsin domain-containing protein n=1 Tax=Orbilia oligospora TaxID=2813651 RepID=A0A6G1M5Q9_ORBOL|nr:hypothetical protein TWF788_009900 [Orbilia oligospora]KAF3207882.1 hypothetical protein TWF679_008214 [Orbilia oligospora]KAF3219264.1 hypothetical protein TWF106_007105 [Orbilia oligospora]KAF3220503.1 hypothetical protein TWF191_007402 [Orbilia oligospora]KAF3244740.1 hypothetical protein TWF192_007673 [Orbilia oligospora]